MSDKPLDCVGTTGIVGKHDFKLYYDEQVKHALAEARKKVRPLIDEERKASFITADIMGFRMMSNDVEDEEP